MTHEIVSENLPHPKFVYSQAVKAGNLVFVAGQAGVNFATGYLAEDFLTQARQAFENVKLVVEAAGTTMDKVIKTTIWLCNAANFDALNKLYAEYFPVNPPARSTPVVALPKDNLMISIEVVAVIN
ncbi:MAG: RidA family protein [Chitinophaga sp.]|jgi:2-iminobutanoate/2-iminopropanoate deaminase|nr:RidA family protein [Chitinophaga sp.]